MRLEWWIPLTGADRALAMWGALVALPAIAALWRAVWRAGFHGPAVRRRELAWWLVLTVLLESIALPAAMHAAGLR